MALMLHYQYVAPELRVFHGDDSLASLKKELDRNKCSRAVVVCGRTVGQSSALGLLRDALGPLLAGVTTTARENSPVSAVNETARFIETHNADAIIAVGGGSAAVTSRAAAIAVAEKKPIAELCTRRTADGKFESPRLNAPKLPQFIVPTTPSTAFVKAGTAVHDDDGQRLALFDPKTRSKAIFVHPAFIATAPASLAQGSALNALANAVEALESPTCDPFSEALLMQALRLIRASLPALASDDPDARERLVVAAMLCGRGTEQGGTGLASVLAHAIGHRSHVANGIVNAIVLPHTMRYNAPATGERGLAVIEAMGQSPSSQSSANVVEAFLDRIPGPRRLADIGIGRDDLSEIASAAMSDWFITRNPRAVPNAQALVELLDGAC
jgi:alcohol dehydrogenase class IV